MGSSQSTQKLALIGACCSGKTTLFNGLKRRLEGDPRFAFVQEAARAFSSALRQEVDLNQLSEHLLSVVQETMQPTHVSLWLRHPEPSRNQNTHLLQHIEKEE